MTTVGLIQLGEYHTEILGGVITAFLRPEISIRVYTPKYRASFVAFYRKIFKDKNVSWIYNDKYSLEDLSDKINKECDFFVFLTGHDYEDIQTDPKRTLLINHTTDDIKRYNSFDTCGQIALSPVFKPKKVRHFINAFEGPLYKKDDKTVNFCIVGLTNPRNKDIKKLEKTLKYIEKQGGVKGCKVKFHVINYYELPESISRYQKSGLVKGYVDATATKTMQIIGKADYVMVLASKNSSYHRKQLSGVIPLSISVGTPLICDKDLAKIYGMSRISITYDFEGEYLINAIKKAVKKVVKHDTGKLISNVLSTRTRIIKRNRKFRFPCLKSPAKKRVKR